MTAAGARRRGGIRRKGAGWEAYVRLHHGGGGLATKRFPLDAERTAMHAWIDDTVHEYRRRHPRGAPGTLLEDVARYLKLLVNRPKLQKERTLHLAWWCERFGDRARWSLTTVELKTALNELQADEYAASTVRHYRTALFHLFTELDGKNAPNPLRDVAPPRQPDPLPRALPYGIIDAIVAAMPDRGQGRRHQKRPKVSQTKARLRVMAYTGIPPAQLRLITAADINERDPSVLVHGRKKGGGTRPVRLPLTPHGLEAFRAFAHADAWGAFSPSSARASFRRAIKAMCDALEEKPETAEAGKKLRAELAGARPYDLRHSYLTEAQLASGNLHATQGLAMHADIRQTQRYTLAAVAPQLKAAAELLAARLPANLGPTSDTTTPEKTTTKPKKPARPSRRDRRRGNAGKRGNSLGK